MIDITAFTVRDDNNENEFIDVSVEYTGENSKRITIEGQCESVETFKELVNELNEFVKDQLKNVIK